MADNPADAPGGAASADADAGTNPQVMVLSQYIKDLSFENPRAPANFNPEADAPQVNVNVNVGAKTLADNQYEVELRVEAAAKQGEETVFVAELVYAGVFSLTNATEAQRSALLLVECPRLLFPFARNIVADVTREGGFPPLLIQPIDFVALFQRQQAQESAAGTA